MLKKTAMAASNANTDSLPTANADAESKMEKSDLSCEPQNNCNNDGTTSGGAEPVDQSVPASDAKPPNALIEMLVALQGQEFSWLLLQCF